MRIIFFIFFSHRKSSASPEWAAFILEMKNVLAMASRKGTMIEFVLQVNSHIIGVFIAALQFGKACAFKI